jgi:fucose permease
MVRDLRLMLMISYLIQAAGVALSLIWPTLPGFALGSLLVGLPFTAITYFAMQEARRIRAQRMASTIGLLTALYGLGQILGPQVAAYLLSHTATPASPFNLALEIAAGSLLLGAALYGLLIRAYPVLRS